MYPYKRNPPPSKPGYWGAREHMKYYQTAIQLAQQYTSNVQSILDIGGRDCLYSLTINAEKRITIDPDVGPNHPEITWLRKDFMQWEPDQIYDLTFCLQVLEHLSNPEAFLQKILLWSKVAIVSVPFNWPPTEGHLQNYLQPTIFEQWAGKTPDNIVLVTEECGNRPPLYWTRILAVFLATT